MCRRTGYQKCQVQRMYQRCLNLSPRQACNVRLQQVLRLLCRYLQLRWLRIVAGHEDDGVIMIKFG